ncbi:RTA1 like protein-domain-containing protein [Xylariaceae sp. FL0016]|nr:RTA1 like protein-domain-containing protein [Xylariaceae sp. FL0016]
MEIPTPTSAPTSLTSTLHHVVRQATAAAVTQAPSSTTAIDFISTEHVTIVGVTNAYVTNPGRTIDIAIPTCVQTLVPDANGHLPPGTCNAIWDYYPSFGAALAFAVLFAALSGAHVFQAVRLRKGFCWVIIMASVWETLAYVFRAISTRFQQNAGIYLIFQIFILLSPLWVNAFAYMVLGRLIHQHIPARTIFSVPAPVLGAGFVALDFAAFGVQLAGGSMAGPTAPPAQQLRAIHVYMGGIGLQQLFIVVFVAFAARFQLEMRRGGGGGAVGGGGAGGETALVGSGWFRLLIALYASLAFITIRIIFRLVEFSSGSTGVSNPLVTHEAYFYVLEAVPMVLAVLAFNIVHPGTVLTWPGSEMPGFFATCTGFFRKKKEFEKIEEGSGGDEMSSLQKA